MGNTLASVSNSVTTGGSDDSREDYDVTILLDSVENEQGWPMKLSRELQAKTVERLKYNTSLRTPPPSATTTADECSEIPSSSRSSISSANVILQDPNGILGGNVVVREEKLSSDPLADVETLFTEHPACIVSVIGAVHQGKTHILNNLSGSLLRTGKSHPTEGICLKIPKRNTGRDWLLIDTQGWGGPVSTATIKKELATIVDDEQPRTKHELEIYNMRKQETALQKAIEDKSKTETIIDDFVFNVSNFVLLVTSEVGWLDQKKLIEMSLKKKTKVNPSDGKPYSVNFIIIHNYKDIDNSSEFNRMVQRYVIESFPGELRSREVSGGFAPYYASGEVNHVFLAKDYSEPGRKYNSLTYQLIRTWLATPTNIDRISSISTFLTQNLSIVMRPHIPDLTSLELVFVERNDDQATTEDDVTTTDTASSDLGSNRFKAPRNDLGQYGEFMFKCIRNISH
jgi:hypothetical protein